VERRLASRPALIASTLALLGALHGAPALGADDPLAPTRKLFTLAYAAAEAGAPLPRDSAALRTYPLYPYLQRARLVRTLGKAAGPIGPADRETEAFLTEHAGEPVAADLRRAWLRSLAARSLWPEFAAAFEPRVADAALRCQALNGRIAHAGDERLQADVVAQWLTAERLPPECERAFEWLRTTSGLPDDLVVQRVELLLRNNQTEFARLVARRLPPARAARLVAAADVLDRPTRGIDALIAEPAAHANLDKAVLLAAWRKLARAEPHAALERYAPLQRALRFDDESMSPFALALALGLAWDREAEAALRMFRSVEPADLDDQALAWRARAALWQADWRLVRRTIPAMSTAQQAEPRWRYWAARAAEADGDDATAAELYRSILPSDNFYAASAATRLGEPAVPHPEVLLADDAAIDSLAALPAIVRARELLLVGLRGAAFTEWQAGTAALDDTAREQAIHLAARWQWHDVSVATATRQRVFFDYELLYPRPYTAAVRDAAELSTVDAPLIYALVRQESLFRSDAVSAAGAMGLAQLLPETARNVARNWRQPAPRAADLLDPTVNVRLGAAHLRELFDSFDAQVPVALAAYNAGPGAAARWLPSSPQPADVWIENIPFNETRDYVQRILWHRVVFAWLENGTGEDFAPWLAPIKPRAARTPDASVASAG
jgi:soluble lytic murein transglycosylase